MAINWDNYRKKARKLDDEYYREKIAQNNTVSEHNTLSNTQNRNTKGIDWDAYRTRAKILDRENYENNIARNRNTSKNATENNTNIKDVTSDNKKRTWFQDSKYFADGKWDAGDLTKTIFGSLTDVGENLGAGIIGMGEKSLDAIAMLGNTLNKSQMGQAAQNEMMFNVATGKKVDGVAEKYDSWKKQTEKGTTDFVKKDLYDEEKIAKRLISTPIKEKTGIDAETDSVFGEKSDALVQSGGQLLATAGLQAIGLPWFLTTGATSFGAQSEDALKEGATYEESFMSATVSAGAEILTEKLSGGIKFGGKTLDDVLVKPLTEKISNKVLKTLVNFGIDAVSEGGEEIVSGIFSNLGTALYKEDDLKDILFSEDALDEYLESFIGGFVLGGVSSGATSTMNNVVNNVQNKAMGKNLIAKGNVGDYIEQAQPYVSENKALKKLADNVANANVENMSKHQFNKYARSVGELYNIVTEKQQNDVRKAISEELKSKNADTATETVDVLLKYVQGENLTEVEQTIFDENNGIDVLDNVAYKMAQTSAKTTTETNDVINTNTFKGNVESTAESDFKQTTYNDKQVSFKYKSHDTVELDSGETVSVEDITMSDDDAVFYDAVTGENDFFPEARFVNGKLTSGVNISTANEIRKIFGGTPTINQLKGVKMYYHYGMYNIKRFGESGALTEAQEKQVFNLGRAFGEYVAEKESNIPKVKKYSKGKIKYNVKSKLNSRQQASVEVVEKLADMFDITFNLYESTLNENGERSSVMPNGEKTTANGYYMNGEIYVDINAGNKGQGAMLYTVAHELTHYIREWSPKKFKMLADFLVEQYESKGKSVDYYVNKQMEKARKSGNKNMKYSEAFEEFVADSMEKMLTDQNAVEKLVALRTKDKSVFDKLREGIQKLVDRIKQEYAKLTSDSAEGRIVATMTDVFSDIQDLFLEALDDASTNFQKAEKNTITDGGVKYSVMHDKSIVDLSKNNELQVLIDSSNRKKYDVIKDYILDLFENEIVTLSDGRKAIIDGRDAKHLAHKANKQRTAELANLKEIFSVAQLIKDDFSVEHNKFSHFAYYGFDVRYENRIYSLVLNVGKAKNSGDYHIYAITNPDKKRNIANQNNGLSRPVGNVKISNVSNNSVPQENTTVNNNSMQENENNAKVKFSERGQTVYELLGENKKLQRDNERLKENVKYLNQLLKLQRKVTHGKIIDRRSTETQARKIIKSTGSKIELSNLADQLYAFYTFIIGSDELVWDDVLTRASWIADDIINAIPQKTQRDEYAQEVLSYIHSKNIRLNDVQRAEVENIYDSYNAYRKRMMGSITISQKGTSLDSVWQDLAEQYPDTFSKDTNPADMPLELADIISSLREAKDIIEEFDSAEQTRWLAEQVYDTYWDVSTVESVMDKMSKEHRLQINELKAQHEERVQKIRDKHQEELDNQKAYYRDMVNRVRQRSALSHKKQMLDYRDKVHEAQARAIEKRNNTETRRKILKTLDKMDALLTRPTKEKNIGLEMQPLACRLLTLVNLDTVDADYRIDRINLEMEHTRNPQTLNALQARIENIKKQGEKKADELQRKRNKYKTIAATANKTLQEIGKEVSVDDVITKTLDDIENLVEATPIRRMTSYQLECLKNAVNMVDGYIRADKQLFIDGKKQNMELTANAVIREVLGNSKKEKQFIKKLEWLNKFGWSMLKPETAFDLIGSSSLSKLFQEARKGDDQFARSVSMAQQFLSENVKKYGADKWNMEERKEFNVQGEKVTLTLGEILSLYAYSKREQAIPHLESGGFVQVEPVKKKIGGKINIEYTVYEDHAHRISDVELGSIINALTKEQVAFADVMQEYLSTVMGAKGNEISRELYQIDLFKEKFYFPLKLSSVYKFFKKNENSKTPVLKNAGMTKPTVVNANDPIVLESFENVWANHVVQMSRYNAYVLGIENLTKVFGYTGIDKSSVRAALQGAYGDAVIKYIENFIIDLNGGRKGMSHNDMVNIASKLVSTFKKVTVSASLSTAIQQPSAVIRAMSYVKPRYFMMIKNEKISHKENWEELKKYAPIAMLKEIGGYDMSSGINVTDFIKKRDYKGTEKIKALFKDSNYRDELLMWGASKGDEFAWSALWNAVKKEQRHRFPNMEKEKFLKICGERFTDVATKTQVYDSVFTRSEIMRSPSETNKMATSFMGEPMTNLNIIIDSIIQTKRGKISKKQAAWNISCVYIAQISAAALASIIYAMRDDDDDESFVEKYMSALGNKVSDELLPVTWIPYIRDVFSILQGYDITRTDMSIFTDLVESFKNLTNERISLDEKITNISGSFAAMFGLPLKNIIRDSKAIVNAITMVFDDNVAESGDVSKAFSEGIFGEKKMADANKYLSKGKTEKANEIIADLMEEKVEKNISNGKTRKKAEKDAKSSIRSSLTTYWKPLFIKAYQEDDYIEQEEIYDRLNSTGIYGTSEELEEAMEKWVKDLQ